MQPDNFTDAKFGQLLKQPQGYWAFVPNPSPPPPPRLTLDWSLVSQIASAQGELSRLPPA